MNVEIQSETLTLVSNLEDKITQTKSRVLVADSGTRIAQFGGESSSAAVVELLDSLLVDVGNIKTKLLLS